MYETVGKDEGMLTVRFRCGKLVKNMDKLVIIRRTNKILEAKNGKDTEHILSGCLGEDSED